MFKKIQHLIFIGLFFISNSVFAQITPDGILFQAVARDANGNAAAGRNIYAKVTILKGTATGTVTYAETFKVVSTDDGIFTIVIGKGTRTAGATGLTNINWNADYYYVNIKIAIEPSLPTPGWLVESEYVDMGTSQLWSVPYALFASRSTIADSALSVSAIVPSTKGGTGVDNGSNIISTNKNLIFKGVGDLTVTTTGTSDIVFPTTGLLANQQYVSDRIGADTISLSNRINAIGIASGNATTLKLNIGDTASMLNPYLRKLDTASLSRRIDIKLDSAQIPGIIAPYLVNVAGVKYVDTAAMLSPYAIKANTESSINTKVNIADTATMLSSYYNKTAADARLNLKVNTGDTAAMLLPYAIRSNTEALLDAKVNITDTATMLSSYYNKTATDAALNLKTNNTDTAAMLLPYAIRSNTEASLDAKVNIADTATMLSSYYNKTATDARLDLKVNTADTAAMLLPYALASNVSTNVGLKLNVSDTSAMLSSFYNMTAVDARLDLKVNSADTATMLLPYAIRSNTEASINEKVNIADTAAMLLPYALASNVTNNVGLKVNISDTASMLLPYAIRSNTEASINERVNITDTATMLSSYYNKTASDSRLDLKVNKSDTASMLLPYAIRSNTIASLDLKAPLISPALTGTPTAPTATAGDISTQIATTAFVAASITNSTTPDATTTSKGKLQLTNDLGGTADLPTVEKVGGSTAANINAATTLANAATASNTANSIVKRDANGNFNAGTITADVLGTSTNVTGIVLGANGGTGINNTGKTITLGGDINTGGALVTTGTTVSNASDITFKTTGTTDLVLPTTGTLTTLTGNEQLSNKTINGLTPTALAAGFSIAGGTSSKTLTVNNNATVSGTNTGDQTITLTGDLTGSGTGSFATTLANSGVTAGTYGSATSVPAITVDAKGRVTNVTNTTISGVSPVGSAMSSGKIIVGDASNVASIVDMTGDVTIDNTGATLIGADKVTTNKILNSNITYAKIQNVTTGKILGRVSAGNGIVEEVATTGTGDVVRAISPTLTGAPQTPTPLVSSNDNTIANTQFVTRAIGNISASSVSGVLPGSNGGTGVDNTGKTITLGGNLTTSGANNLTFTTTGATNVTVPTSGTLATTAQLDAIAGGSFSGGQITGVIAPANGGTGIANTNTITLGGNIVTGAAFTTAGTTGLNASAITLKTTAASTLTLPTTGVLATLDGTETLTNKTITAATNTISGLTNANLSGTAGITDANLATIATAGKVLNTATSATSSNTANAIVSRDATGNFTAGTITANLAGNAATTTKLATARSIYGNSFDGTADLGQVIAASYGGTGNAYTKFTGATTAEKIYTLPDANTTILTTNALITPAQGGTGVATAAMNTFFAGPASGSDAAPSFRTLTGADLPAGSGLYIANSTSLQASSNFNISGTGVVTGSLTAGSIVKKDGTSAQFLKADGSVDARSFATLTGTEALTNKSINGITPTAVTTGFTLAGGLTNSKTLTVAADANVAGTNTGDMSIAGENYLSLTNQVLTANAVNLSGSNVTGLLAAARFPALTGDITNTAGAVATTISANAVTSTKIAENAVTSTKIADNAISSAKIATSAVTLDKIASISVQKLLGNKSASAAGAPGEIAIGAGLALDATTGVLSASGTGGTVTGTGTAGQMPYWSTASGLGSTPNFIWDNTNKNIKIGENVNMAGVDSDLPSGVTTPIIGIVGKVNDLTEQTMLSMKRPLYYGNSVPGFVDFVMKGGNNSSKFDIRMNNFTNPTTLVNVMTILAPGGYVGINNAAPTEKLDVTGNIRFSGALKPNNLSGTAGQFLTSQGAGTPTWTTPANATASVTGFLSNTDWTTFNNKFSLPALTSGSILFSNGTTIAQNNAKLFWDATNNRLGIGNSAPANTLHINASTNDYLRYGLEDGMNTLKIGFNTTGWVFRTAQNSGNTSDLNIMYDNGTTKTGRITLNQIGGVGITGDLTAAGDVTAVDASFTTLKVGTSGLSASATNVGILNSAPSSKFHIGTDAQHALKYDFDAGSSVLQLTRGTTYAFKFATAQNSGVMDRLVMSYVNGATTTELVTYDNSGTSNIAKLATPSFKFTGGTPALGKVLTSDATGNASWSVLNAVSSVGAIAGTSNANGATITSGVLNLTPADETNGGLMTTGAQLFSGNKRFLGLLTLNDKIQLNFSGAAGGGVEFTGDGDIADNNDGYATVRFTNGLKINNAKGSLGTTTKITLGNDGVIETLGLKLTGGTPGAGKVLVSDANGVASWASNSPTSLSGGVAGSLPYQSAAGTTAFTAAGTNGQILTSTGTTAPAWTSVLSIAQGGTGTSTQNFVDLSTDQIISGIKTFNTPLISNSIKIGKGGGQGEQNTAIGTNLGTGTGSRNTAIGYNAMSSYTGTGTGNNTSVGYQNSVSLSTGKQNTSIGAEALMTLSTANANTAIGAQSLMASTGANNTALGYSTASIIGAGTNNTFLGAFSTANLATINNATAVGYGAIVTADNTIQLGNTSVTTISTTGTFSTSGSINASGAITTPIYASTPVALTAGATITWSPLSGLNASVTLNANSTLAFGATPPAGSSGTLIVTQPATGGPYNLTLPTVAGKTNKVLGSSSGILLSTTAGAKDIVSFFYDGNDFYWNVGMGYGMAQNVSANTVSGGEAGAILYQTAANTTGFSAAGTTGQYLRSNGTTAPTWSTISNASASASGLLSSADWTTFNSKQNSITNPVTGTGVISALPFWSSTSALASNYTSGSTYTNGLYWDNTNGRLGVNTKYPTSAFQVGDAGSSENTKYTTALNFDYDLSLNSSLSLKIRNEKFDIRTASSSGVWTGIHFSYNPTSSTIGSRIDFMSFDPSSQVVSFNKLRLAGNGAGAGKFLISDASGNATWSSGSFVDLSTAQNVGGTKTFTATGNGAIVNNNLTVNAAGTSGQGIVLSDDGDIVDMNDGAATFRFSGGVKINNGKSALGTTNAITLSNNGNINATGSITSAGSIVAGAITYPNVAGTNGYVLTTNGTNTATWAAPSGAVSGGTTNAIPKYTSATALGASSITDDGTNISFSNKTVAGGSAAVNSASIVAATTAYTLTQSDNGKVINCANTGALTITIPSGLTAGFNCMIVQMAAGSVTISAGSSVTIYNRSNYSKTGGQYAIATIVSPSTNVFITGGDMQ